MPPMERVDSFRYTVVRALCCPTPLLPKSTPLIGNKTVVELLVTAVVCGVTGAMIASLDSEAVGRLADYLGAIAILFSFRKVAILNVVGISFERGLYWHKILAVCFLVAMLLHGIAEGINNTGIIFGIIAGAMSLVYLLAYLNISFNLFYYVHVVCYLAIAPIAILHGARYMGFFVLIWAADLIVRYWLQGRKAEATLSMLSQDVVKVSLPNTYREKDVFESGQYFFLMVPAINVYEYHPFTIASAPHDEELVFYVKNLGDWTDKLCALTKAADGGAASESGATATTTVYLEGPYGKLSVDAFKGEVYPASILVSGGVGVTPMMSMLAHYAHEGAAGKLIGMKKIVFVWTVRDKAFASKVFADFFQPLFEKHFDKTNDACVFMMKGASDLSLHFHVHVTNTKPVNPSTGSNKVACVDDNNNGTELAPTQKNGSTDGSSLFASGRPDLAKIFAQAAEAVSADKKSCLNGRVSVCVCGPKVMVDSVRGLQVSASRSTGTTFDLHEELFNF